MQFATVTCSAAGESTPIRVDFPRPGYFGIGFGIVITGTGTYKVQHTFDDPESASAVWFNHVTATGKTANYDDNYQFPIRGLRLNCTAWTSGNGKLKVCIA